LGGVDRVEVRRVDVADDAGGGMTTWLTIEASFEDLDQEGCVWVERVAGDLELLREHIQTSGVTPEQWVGLFERMADVAREAAEEAR
jgi:hypothetical protein